MNQFNRYRNFLMLFISCFLLNDTLIAAQSPLPDIGSSVNKHLSVNKEQLIGDVLVRQLKGQAPLLQDILVTDYLKTVGFKIVSQNPDAMNRKFDFFLINAPSINAFAMPGGYIAVHSQLILKADTEDELAGVLAHEIAHVTQRHLARRFERSNQLSIPTMIGVFASLIAATQSSGNGGNVAMGGLSAVLAGQQQILINYTRANEAEADRVGIQSLANAGYNPDGMSGFFEKMLREYRNLPKPPEFLLTHPISERRLAEARNRAFNLVPHKNHSQNTFWIMQERIRAQVITDKALLNEKWYQQRIKQLSGKNNKAHREALLHGYSLWLSQHNKTRQAVNIAKKLVAAHPKNIAHTDLLASAYIKNKQPEKAKQLLLNFLHHTPLNFPLSITLAQAEMELKDYANALNLLLSLAYQHPDVAELFKILAKAQAAAGKEDESRESQGQYLYATGDLNGALFQYNLALNGRSIDPYFNKRVRARINAIEEELLTVRGGRGGSRKKKPRRFQQNYSSSHNY